MHIMIIFQIVMQALQSTHASKLYVCRSVRNGSLIGKWKFNHDYISDADIVLVKVVRQSALDSSSSLSKSFVRYKQKISQQIDKRFIYYTLSVVDIWPNDKKQTCWCFVYLWFFFLPVASKQVRCQSLLLVCMVSITCNEALRPRQSKLVAHFKNTNSNNNNNNTMRGQHQHNKKHDAFVVLLRVCVCVCCRGRKTRGWLRMCWNLAAAAAASIQQKTCTLFTLH